MEGEHEGEKHSCEPQTAQVAELGISKEINSTWRSHSGLNGAQLHTASAIIAFNRSQLHLGCSDYSCTFSTPPLNNRKRVREREEAEGRQREQKNGQDEEISDRREGEWVPLVQTQTHSSSHKHFSIPYASGHGYRRRRGITKKWNHGMCAQAIIGVLCNM